MKLTLHIGAEKTGTTSIQKALWQDRSKLADKKILVPTLFGSSNHMEVAAAACRFSATSELQIAELTRQACSHDVYFERLHEQIRQEVGSGDFDQILISNEHCHSRIMTALEVSRLLDLFDTNPKNCVIIVYLRRQDRLAVSLYSTVLKLGGAIDLFPKPIDGVLPSYFDFERLLNLYALRIPKENFRIRIYEPPLFHLGNVVNDFYEVAQLGIDPSIMPEENKSLSLAQGLFLEQFNKSFPLIKDEKINLQRGSIAHVIRNILPEKKWLPKRDLAATFYHLFKESNERVLKNYLPDQERPSLFEDDFQTYPSESSQNTLSQEELMQFIEAIWRYRNRS